MENNISLQELKNKSSHESSRADSHLKLEDFMRREDTRVIQIGNVKIGGGNPIAIQSMTNTKTEDVEATIA